MEERIAVHSVLHVVNSITAMQVQIINAFIQLHNEQGLNKS
jgi:hypothetical protein